MAKQTMKNQVFERIRHFKPGRAFLAKDLPDIASRGTVDMALSACEGASPLARSRLPFGFAGRINECSLNSSLSVRLPTLPLPTLCPDIGQDRYP